MHSICVASETGTHPDQNSCQRDKACSTPAPAPDPWKCKTPGSPYGVCSQALDGKYPSESKCAAAAECLAPPPPGARFRCDNSTDPANWKCVIDPAGGINKQSQCVLSCVAPAPKVKWRCSDPTNSACIQDAGGGFDSQELCKADPTCKPVAPKPPPQPKPPPPPPAPWQWLKALHVTIGTAGAVAVLILAAAAVALRRMQNKQLETMSSRLINQRAIEPATRHHYW